MEPVEIDPNKVIQKLAGQVTAQAVTIAQLEAAIEALQAGGSANDADA